jgi:hypothetical protein
MLTQQKSCVTLPPELMGLPEVEYPGDVVERWVKEAEIAKAQLATGELAPQTVEEFAAENGITWTRNKRQYG